MLQGKILHDLIFLPPVAAAVRQFPLPAFLLDMMAHDMRPLLAGRGISIDKVKGLILQRGVLRSRSSSPSLQCVHCGLLSSTDGGFCLS